VTEPRKPPYGRLAKRRLKLLAMDGTPEERTQRAEMAATIEQRLRGAEACIACGRPLRNTESKALGLGPECASNKQQEAAE
jgi:hypothetical protein